MGANRFSPMEIDAIGEILNISLGASATAASTMLDARVDITTPVVQVKKRDEFTFTNLEPAVGVEITYIDGLTGDNVMLLKRQDVKAIVEMLMGMEIADEDFELNEMNISAICEVMNQMMGASATALSELIGKPVNISTPRSYEIVSDEQFKDKYFTEKNSSMVVISFRLNIAGKLESEFMNLMPINLAKELVSGFFPEGMLLGDEEDEEETESKPPMEEPALPEPEPVPEPVPVSIMPQPMEPAVPFPEQETAQPAVNAAQPQMQQPVMTQPQMQQPVMMQPQMQQPVYQQPVYQPQPAGDAVAVSKELLEIQRMQMELMQQMQQMRQMETQQQERKPRQVRVHSTIQPSLHDGGGEINPDSNLDLIMGVPVEVSVEIGRTKKLVKDVLELNKGSLVVLDKLAGEQVDLFVNGQCIAKGDVVVVDDNFGIRITQILSEDIPAV